MPWSKVVSSDDVVAIHAILLPTRNGDGEILLFGGDDHDRNANLTRQWDHSRLFNCREPTRPLAHVQSPDVDLFCCGHARLGDGHVLVSGGTTTFPPDSGGIHAHIHFEGHRHAFTFEPGAGLFREVSSMNFETGKSSGGGRWYPSLCTLATGDVLAVAGHPAGDDTRHSNNEPERYEALGDRWVRLAPIGPEQPPAPDLYPRLHLLRDGMVFVSSVLQGNPRCIAIDPRNGAKAEICDLPDSAYWGFDCPSVLLPLTPADGYRPRVLLCGGAVSQVIDLGSPSRAWVTVPRRGTTSGIHRSHASATILPTGDVLMTGGADPANDQAGVALPELYALPVVGGNGTPSYGGAPGSWRTLDEPATVLRNYHSTALLMPDGRVWTAGGNSPSQPDAPPGLQQKLIEIYDPPYPAGVRVTISHAPPSIAYGEHFEITTSDATKIQTVTLVRCGSSTHAFNPDQRCIFLSFERETLTKLKVVAPPGGTVAPPGDYMLFVIDNERRPCAYAAFVRVGLPSRFPATAHVALLSQSGLTQTDAFAIDKSGRLNVAWVVGAGAWQGPVAISGAVAPPGAPLAASQQFGLLQSDVFFVDNGGHLNVAWVQQAGQWNGPVRISGPVAPPAANLTASKQFGLTQTDVFFVDDRGHLNVSWATEGGQWNGPLRISGAVAPPGANVAASQQFGLTQTDVFFVDIEGHLNVAWVVEGGQWHEPIRIGGPIAPPGAPVAATQQFGLTQTDVFLVDNEGHLNVAWVVEGGHWNGPVRISGPVAPPGAAVSASQQFGLAQTDVFFVDNEGHLNVAWVVESGPWNGPVRISGTIAKPGAPVAAARQTGLDQSDVVLVDRAGRLDVTWVVAAGVWAGPVTVG